jgi:pyrrolidone-carboxylate peptidase
VQSGNLDDRPLYWARNKMQTWLKRNPLFKDQIDFDKSIVKKGTELDDIITLFEEKSRNYTGIDFSKAGNKKKVLITGFDPFQLDYGFYGDRGVQTYNPSGIIALALQENQELLKNNIYIQTCIFPVRYEDFDNQVVEKVVKRNIQKLNLLITTSLNGSNSRFDIEKYAIEYRGGFHDNMCIGDYDNPKYDKSRFLANKNSNLTQTTLPKEKIFGTEKNTELYGQSIYFDTEQSKTTGSGDNYLSNEVMYRATSVRGNLDLPVGHFHLGNLGDIKNTIDTKEIVIAIIKKILL